MPLLAEPGESWSYSVGFDILGDLVEVVSGVSLGDCLQSKLFFDIRNDRYVLLD
jgi:CubicO group peptidase (beta-lactamase class C family)